MYAQLHDSRRVLRCSAARCLKIADRVGAAELLKGKQKSTSAMVGSHVRQFYLFLHADAVMPGVHAAVVGVYTAQPTC